MKNISNDFITYTTPVSPQMDALNIRLISREIFEFIVNSRIQEALLEGKMEGLKQASETMTELLK